MKFGTGALYKVLLNKRKFRVIRLSNSCVLLTGLNEYPPLTSRSFWPIIVHLGTEYFNLISEKCEIRDNRYSHSIAYLQALNFKNRASYI